MFLTHLSPREVLEKLKPPREAVSDPTPDEDLVESIRNVGVKVPIIVDRNYVIIDGVRRFNAIRKLLQEGVELPLIPVLILNDVDYEASPEEALLCAFLVNRYRRGGRDDHFNTDLIADLLLKLALRIAKPVERQDLRRGTIPERVRRELAKLTGLSRTHVYELLQKALARRRLGVKSPCTTAQVCQSCRVESSTAHPEDVSTLQTHSIPRHVSVQSLRVGEHGCGVIHGRCTIGTRPSGRGEHQEGEDLSRVVDAVCTAAERLGSGFLRKVALGELPTRVAEEAGRILNRSTRTVFEYWYRHRDAIVEEARRRYLADLKVPKSKAELFLRLPEDFIRWLRQLSPWLLKRVVEHVDPDVVEQAARLFQHGRERDSLRILVEAARGRDISRVDLPDHVMDMVIELGTYVDLDLALRAIVEVGAAFLRLLQHKARSVPDPRTFCESAIRQVLSLSSIKDVQDLWHEVRDILDMVKP